MSDTYERLCGLLVSAHKVAPEALRPDAPLEDLGIDSLGTVELLWHVEEAFDIKLPAQPPPLATLADVVGLIDQLRRQQAAGPALTAA
jgi:acyl carrier protein